MRARCGLRAFAWLLRLRQRQRQRFIAISFRSNAHFVFSFLVLFCACASFSSFFFCWCNKFDLFIHTFKRIYAMDVCVYVRAVDAYNDAA